MEENNKAQELALKMAGIFNDCTVGETLNALEVTIICIIRSIKDEPLKQIVAYSQIINSLSEEMIKIAAENILKQKINKRFNQ